MVVVNKELLEKMKAFVFLNGIFGPIESKKLAERKRKGK